MMITVSGFLLLAVLMMPLAARAQGGSPFDSGFTAMQTLFTGTVAKVTSLIAIVLGGYRSPKEQRLGATQRGHVWEIETVVENPDAEPVMPCAATKTAIIVYGKRAGTSITVCTDNHYAIHDPRAAGRLAENPAPTMPPSPEAETDEQAEERKQQHKQEREEYEAEQERRANAFTEQREREEQEYEAEQARKEEQRKVRAAIFERILTTLHSSSPHPNSASYSVPSSTSTLTPSPTTWPRTLQGTMRTKSAAPKRYCFPPSTRPQTTS